MNAPANFFLHLGLPKTGSTTLQEAVFPFLSGVHLSVREPDGHGRHLERVRYRSVEAAKLAGGEHSILHHRREKFHALPRTATKVLISNENILGPHPDGNAVLIKRLAFIVGPARVILVLRDPFDLIQSLYRQTVDTYFDLLVNERKRAAPPGTFEEFIRRALTAGVSGQLSFLHFDEMVNAFEARFGPDNVLILHYAMLRTDPEDFADHIFSFIGTRAPRSTIRQKLNVSLDKVPSLTDSAKRVGSSAQDIDAMKQEYLDLSLSAETRAELEAYAVRHASTAQARFNRPVEVRSIGVNDAQGPLRSHGGGAGLSEVFRHFSERSDINAGIRLRRIGRRRLDVIEASPFRRRLVAPCRWHAIDAPLF